MCVNKGAMKRRLLRERGGGGVGGVNAGRGGGR